MVKLKTFNSRLQVALFAMARKTKRFKYIRAAYRVRKKIVSWAKSGNPNVKHYECFLEAEHTALKGKKSAAKVKYEAAIRKAARTGHLHHAALFNERFADFLQHDVSDEEESSYRLNEAILWYEEWGAKRKVEMLKEVLNERDESNNH